MYFRPASKGLFTYTGRLQSGRTSDSGHVPQNGGSYADGERIEESQSGRYTLSIGIV